MYAEQDREPGRAEAAYTKTVSQVGPCYRKVFSHVWAFETRLSGRKGTSYTERVHFFGPSVSVAAIYVPSFRILSSPTAKSIFLCGSWRLNGAKDSEGLASAAAECF